MGRTPDLVPDRRSEGGVRYYDMGKILGRLKFHRVGRSIALN